MYKIADFVFEFGFRHFNFRTNSLEYKVPDTEACAVFTCSEEEKEIARNGDESIKKNEMEFLILHRKLAEWLPLHNAFVLHCACFDVNGTGVAFAAQSGTGKSTHMMLWQKLLGDKMTIVNGDKPIVRFFDEEPNLQYAYGTPWMGKEQLGCNMRTPLKHICFITRSETNSTKPLTKAEGLPRIMNQVYMPKDPAALSATLKLINRLLDSVQLWEIRCNMELDAAKIAYSALFGEQAE